MAKALRYLHGKDPAHPLRHPVLHMDVKPENCLLFAGGELKLTDFDAARRPRRGAS